MAKMAGYSHDDNVRDARAGAEMFLAINTIPAIVIGRIHGAALGGGSGLAAVCDIVVAEEDAIFGFTETKLGILPAMISPYVLQKIGASAARELFLTGMRFDARRPRRSGSCTTWCRRPISDEAVDGYVREALSASPTAVARAKALIPNVLGRPPAEVIGITAEAIAAQRVSPEGQEGLKAFLEKRTPRGPSRSRMAMPVIRRLLIANRGEIARAHHPRLPRARHRNRRRLLRCGCERAARVARPTAPCAIGAPPARESYSTSTRSSRPRDRAAPKPCIPVTDSSPSARPSRARVKTPG